MNIDHLNTFIAVANNKSFSRTASSLRLTQPAVSKRVVALETELSTRLFIRGIGRSIYLTETGLALLPSACRISDEWARIEKTIENLADGDVRGCLRIGTSEHTATHLMLEILETFRKRYPKATVELLFGNSQETLHALESGTLELALCTLPEKELPRHTAKLEHSPVWSEKLVFVASYDHPITALGAISLSDLANYPAILPHGPSLLRSLTDNAFKQKGLVAPVSMEASDFETIRNMASIGLGWACLPEFLLDDTLIVLEVDEVDLNRVVSLISLNERTLSNAAQAFQSLLLEHYPALDNSSRRRGLISAELTNGQSSNLSLPA